MASLKGLVDDGIFSRRWSRFTNSGVYERPLHLHQEVAILRDDNCLVATGTGSGKTEGFLYPLVDDLLKEPDLDQPGVRAILVYPLNALANDQLLRIAALLLRDLDDPGISLGRYTGAVASNASREDEANKLRAMSSFEEIFPGMEEIPQNWRLSRDDMRNRPPHILITNYAMLEHILLLPKNRPLFNDALAQNPVGVAPQIVVLLEFGKDRVLLTNLADDSVEGSIARRKHVHHRRHLVVGDVEVEVPVTVHVCQRHGVTPELRLEAGFLDSLREDAGPVVDEQGVRTAQRRDEKVQVPIAIDVGEDYAGGEPVIDEQSRSLGCVLEAPVAEIAVESVRPVQTPEVDVDPPVPVDVSQGHSGSIGQMPVLYEQVRADVILESDAGLGSRKVREPRGAVTRSTQGPPTVLTFVVPGPVRYSGARPNTEREQPPEDRGSRPQASATSSKSTIT